LFVCECIKNFRFDDLFPAIKRYIRFKKYIYNLIPQTYTMRQKFGNTEFV